MDSIDYLITAHGVIERGLFYNYMHDLGFKDNINFTREYMVNNDYPFGVCLKKKKLMNKNLKKYLNNKKKAKTIKVLAF